MKLGATLYVADRKSWRAWLAKRHKSETEIWLVYYKKHTGKPSIPYNDAVEEAICFGWIDGQVKKIDDERYAQRFSPRKVKSSWSEINIQRAKKMIEQGNMTEWGREIYEEGMKTNRIVPSSRNFSIPADLKTALIKNKKAWGNFQNLSPSAKLAHVYWVTTAKREETRQKRIDKTVELMAQNKKLGDA